MERTLALICGAGPLPARMARQARRDGWRVLAFTFAEAEGCRRVRRPRGAEPGDRTRPGAGGLPARRAWRPRSSRESSGCRTSCRADRAQADAVAASFETQAQSRSDADLSRVVLVDARRCSGSASSTSGTSWATGWPGRRASPTALPAEDEWRDVRTGLRVARALADSRRRPDGGPPPRGGHRGRSGGGHHGGHRARHSRWPGAVP